MDAVGQYYERVLGKGPSLMDDEAELPSNDLLKLMGTEPTALAFELIDTYLSTAELLGKRTAELHLALASDQTDPAFAPEPITPHYQQSLYQAVRTQAVQGLTVLRKGLGALPPEVQEQANRLLSMEGELHHRLRAIATQPLTGMRIRCHGDYHLGQVLYTGKDFSIIDFEGEPARPLSERRIKRAPLRDVAGMLRSFDYAAHAALSHDASGAIFRPEDAERLEPWARFWTGWVSAAFLRSYLALAGDSGLLPRGQEELGLLLNVLLLEKAFYELSYDLHNRPSWVSIPLDGVLNLLAT
jgi:maltose alpha-D-glucosyltransferase/alpha-amylase